MALQSAVLGVGAYLVIQQEASAGIMIASSILAGRALAPIDLAIANWKGFIAARQSWRRLDDLFAAMPAPAKRLAAARPRQRRWRSRPLSVAPPGAQKLVVHDVNFSLAGRQCARHRRPQRLGQVVAGACDRRGVAIRSRLRAARWGGHRPMDAGGARPHIGYLPQDVELFEGTIAENIARFEPDAPAAAVIAAAKAAGVHDLIVNLPDGYETQLGERGTALSAGQQQRIALARALYGEPFLVVLDEPNSNLDAEGEEALTKAILGVRARGGIVIVVAHRPSALAAVDQCW